MKVAVFAVFVLALLSGPVAAGGVNDVAVLDSSLTRRFMPNPTYYTWEMGGAFAALDALGLSYAILKDEDLTRDKLQPFKVLILPGSKNITPHHVQIIRDFVDKGGKLLAAGFASYRDEHDQAVGIHNNFQLSDLFGVDYLRYSPHPPHSGLLKPIPELGEEPVECGRNTSIQVRPHAGTTVLALWLDDSSLTLSAPASLDAAIVENKTRNVIYVGENLFAPENSNSPDVRGLIALLLNRLGLKTNPQDTYISSPVLPQFGALSLFGKSKPVIDVGLPLTPLTGFVTSEGGFSVYDGGRRLVVAAAKEWKIAFNPQPRGFQVAGKTGLRFFFTPRNPAFPLKIVLWHGEPVIPISPFKFAAFRGELILLQSGEKKMLINRLPLEAYLSGVVSHEVPFYFHPSALGAMAVVARTVAEKKLKEKPFKDYDICATVSCQAYEGLLYESSSARDAVLKTSRQVLHFNHALPDLPYHATCGGVSEAIEHVWNAKPAAYLPSVVDGQQPVAEDLTRDEGVEHFLSYFHDSFCKFSSRYRWKETYSRMELEQLFQESLPAILKHPVQFNQVTDMHIEGRTPHGRVTGLTISTDQGKFSIGKDRIRWLFSRGQVGLGGLQSTFFVFQKHRDSDGTLQEVVFSGGGWGHGVGLCQFGAEGMSRQGFTTAQILSHYFPGAEITVQK